MPPHTTGIPIDFASREISEASFIKLKDITETPMISGLCFSSRLLMLSVSKNLSQIIASCPFALRYVAIDIMPSGGYEALNESSILG